MTASTKGFAPHARIHAAVASASRVLFVLFALSMPAYALARMAWGEAGAATATAATALAWFLCSLALCIHEEGASRAALFLGSGFAIAFGMEYLGSRTGFLFGAYTYTELLGPKMWGYVPLLIPLAWFMMLYPSWCIAGWLARDKPARVAVAALAMTAWDLSLDPRMVADGAWVWHDGGAYFGIPLTNFVGWLVTAAMIFGVWSVPARDTGQAQARSRLPEWVFVIAWLGESAANVFFWERPLVGLATFLGMGVFAVPALLRIHRNAAYNSGPRHG